MKKAIRSSLLPALMLVPGAGLFAALSGMDAPAWRAEAGSRKEAISSDLAAAERRFAVLASTPSIVQRDFDQYRDSLFSVREKLEGFLASQEEKSARVEGLARNEPAPEDLAELIAVRNETAAVLDSLGERYNAGLADYEKLRQKFIRQTAAAAGEGEVRPAGAARLTEEEKKRKEETARKLVAMGEKEKAFAEITELSAADPAMGRQMMDSFFDGLTPQERARFEDPAAARAANGPSADSGPETVRPSPAGKRTPGGNYGLSAPGTPVRSGSPGKTASAADEKDPGPAMEPSALMSPENRIAAWNAVGAFYPSVAAPRIREAGLDRNMDLKAAWLERQKDRYAEMAAGAQNAGDKRKYGTIAAELDKRLRQGRGIASLEGAERTAAVSGWNASVAALMDKSPTASKEREILARRASMDAEYASLPDDGARAAWIEKNRAAYDADGEALAGLYAADPDYLEVRKGEADHQAWLRASLPNFAEGTSFPAGELGLPLEPGTEVKVARHGKGGPLGISYNDPDGLRHFQSLDDTVRVNEVRDPKDGLVHAIEQRVSEDGTLNVSERLPGGGLFRTEERRPDGTVTMEVYGRDGKPVASRRRGPDGTVVDAEVLAEAGVKRTVTTAADGRAVFAIEPLAGGLPRQSGRVVDGRLVVDRVEGPGGALTERVGGYVMRTTVNGKTQGMSVDMAGISGLPEKKRGAAIASAAEVLAGDDRTRDGPIKQFLAQAARQGGNDGRLVVDTVKDSRGGTALLAEISYPDGHKRQIIGQWVTIPAGQARGLSDNTGLDISVRSAARGEDISGREPLKLFRFNGEDTTDRYSGVTVQTGNWFVGYGVRRDNYITRTRGAGRETVAKMKIGSDELFDSPSILGHTGNAIGTLGRGAVQLTGAGISVIGAGTVGWADEHLQRDLLERAKSNFYGNDISRTLGRNMGGSFGDYYRQGYEDLRVDEDRNIQNVGREMAGFGKPTLGAVLQGGVEFSNGVATSLIVAPAMGGIGTASKTGAVLTKGYGAYMGARGVYNTGASAVEFVGAYRAYDENDPASKQRYYAAITDLTKNALNAPRTLGRALSLKDTAAQVRGAITGKPVAAPPSSDLRNFLTGKNEPGALTRFMKRDIGIKDPSLNIGAPLSGALSSAEKWVASGVMRLTGGGPQAQPVPQLIVTPGQVTPRPDARIVVPGQPAPRPDVKVIVPGQPAPRPDVKVIVPGQPAPRPDAKIIVPGQPAPRPDAKIIVPGQVEARPDAEIIIDGN